MWDDIDWLCGFTLTFAVFLPSYANEQSVMLKKYIIGIFNGVKLNSNAYWEVPLHALLVNHV